MKAAKLTMFAALVAAFISAPAIAQTDAASAFGAREGIENIALSPDGAQVAFIAPTTGAGNGLFVVPVDKHVPPRRIAVASGAPETLRKCDWTTNTRLLCLISASKKGAGTVLSGARLIALDSNAKNLKPLYGSVVDLLVGEGGDDILVGWGGRYSGVDRLNTATLKSKTVLDGLPLGGLYLSDGAGNVRVGGVATLSGDYQGNSYRYLYRRIGDWRWSPLSTYNFTTHTGFSPSAVDAAKNVVYGLKRRDGRDALYTVALDGTLAEQLVLARDDVDVDGVVRLGRRNRVVGATFVTDRRKSIYFDAELGRLRTALARLFASSAAIDFVGASDDEKTLLVRVSSDTEPGIYFVFDKATRHLEKLILARPEIAAYTLASVKTVEVRAADGTRVPAYLTLPPGGAKSHLPAIVMPHGGPEARDEFGFDWLAQYYANRGFAVLQPNFRGSSGYGDAWFVKNGFQSWAVAVGDIADSGRWLVAQGIADPARLAIVGWSYGGYAALQSGVVAPGLFKAIVAIAPVTDFEALKSESDGYADQFIQRAYIGGGSLAAAGSPARHAASFVAPVLMFHGDLDRNVAIHESKLMEDRLRGAGKPARLVVYPGLDHQLDDSAARADMLRQSDDFLRTSMGIK